MSDDIVIRAEGLGKKYVIGHQVQRERYQALRDVVARNVRNFGRTAMDVVRGRPNVIGDETEDFWALTDVNFEIRRGEVVGVIGRNGAGKSTLLKVLSRITEPTNGRVSIKGRVASLLEVGTGFHPELTGRENIYLNGAILGMAHAEIRRKFDEIVEFAGVEKFLDTPVKRYSSGMYVRLAFAVAAHLEPEILIVDEVLAVGDAEFQKKCLGKMGEVASHGRTILFVSHNMTAMQALCSRVVMLAGGTKVFDGQTHEAINFYATQQRTAVTRARKIDADLTLLGVNFYPLSPELNQKFEVEFKFQASKPENISDLFLIIFAQDGYRIGIVDARECGFAPFDIPAGDSNLVVSIPKLGLVEGEYSVGLHVRTRHEDVELLEVSDFKITQSETPHDFIPLAPEWRGVVEFSTQQPSMRLEAPSGASGDTGSAAVISSESSVRP